MLKSKGGDRMTLQGLPKDYPYLKVVPQKIYKERVMYSTIGKSHVMVLKAAALLQDNQLAAFIFMERDDLPQQRLSRRGRHPHQCPCVR